MKNYLLALSVIALAMASCTKNRSCDCTIIDQGNTKTTTSSTVLGFDTTIVTPYYNVNMNTITFEKTSKRKAKFNCLDRTEQVNETTNNSIPGFFTITTNNTGTREYHCSIK